MVKSYKGWYKLVNGDKFIQPVDETMQSTRQTDMGTFILYKSLLERRAFVYADLNPKVRYFSIEPFAIEYVKPTDNKVHRYYIDLFIEFKNGKRFIIEIKPYNQTVLPKKKNAYELETYMINQAKWESAKEFAKQKNLKFIILTERELN